MVLALVWAACAVAAYLYALQQHIPLAMAAAVFPAFLLEVTLFYALAIDSIRARIEKLPPLQVALGLIPAAVAPYTLAAIATKSFSWEAFFAIAALAAVVAFWYIALPHKPASDILFLTLLAAVWLAKLFHQFYLSPHPKLPMDTLGRLMWFRTGMFAMLCIRRPSGVGFGFWPRRHEWKIGVLYFALYLPIAAVLAWWIHFATPRAPRFGWERTSLLTVATFFGVLWVLALGEEFFFRGLLQQWMAKWLRNEWLGLIVTSLIFGSVHIWLRSSQFPNWRAAAMATLLGLVCGMAFRQAHGIRAPMVTHALVVTTWRIFFA